MITEEERIERADAEEVVAIFDGRFQESYGEGHLLMACYAAFPMAVTPDMIYQIWANFREYEDAQTTQKRFIDRIAVSDVLLWHCWQETDPEVYEMDVAVRACLLDKLRNDSRFGGNRIHQLAQFLHQYTEQTQIINRYGSNFYEAQKWTVMATLAPSKAAERIAAQLTKSVNAADESNVLRLRNVLEVLTGQEERFRGMLYVSKALKAAYLGYDSDTVSRQLELAKGQRGYGLTTDVKPGEPFLTIPTPVDLSNNLTLPSKPASKLYMLAVGIDTYEGQPLKGCVNDARLLLETFSKYSSYPIAHNGLLLNEQATKANVIGELEKLLDQAKADDMVVFTFSGHGQNARQRAAKNTLATYTLKSMYTFSDPDQIADYTITETEFSELIRVYKNNDSHILLITDTHNGSPNWLTPSNPKHIILTAGSNWDNVQEGQYENKLHGVFTTALVKALRSTRARAPQTYHSLIRKIYQIMQDEKQDQTPQLFGTEEALRRPFLSTDDSGVLYAHELIQYCLNQHEPPRLAEKPLDLQRTIDQVLERYAGRSLPFSETTKNELTTRLEQAVTTSGLPNGLSVIGLGGPDRQTFMDEWKNQIQEKVESIDEISIANVTDVIVNFQEPITR